MVNNLEHSSAKYNLPFLHVYCSTHHLTIINNRYIQHSMAHHFTICTWLSTMILQHQPLSTSMNHFQYHQHHASPDVKTIHPRVDFTIISPPLHHHFTTASSTIMVDHDISWPPLQPPLEPTFHHHLSSIEPPPEHHSTHLPITVVFHFPSLAEPLHFRALKLLNGTSAAGMATMDGVNPRMVKNR